MLHALEFQGLLFGDEPEALAQEAERLAAIEYAKARKVAWDNGTPFPEDHAKWCAANWEYLGEQRRAHYPAITEYPIGRARARRLGCKIGRRRPVLRVYRRAVHATVILCYWCKTVTFPGERHVDHIEPLSMGGGHVAGNLCISCIACNLSKGDTSPAEFRKTIAAKRMTNGLIAANYFRLVSSSSSARADLDSLRSAFGVPRSALEPRNGELSKRPS